MNVKFAGAADFLAKLMPEELPERSGFPERLIKIFIQRRVTGEKILALFHPLPVGRFLFARLVVGLTGAAKTSSYLRDSSVFGDYSCRLVTVFDYSSYISYFPFY